SSLQETLRIRSRFREPSCGSRSEAAANGVCLWRISRWWLWGGLICPDDGLTRESMAIRTNGDKALVPPTCHCRIMCERESVRAQNRFPATDAELQRRANVGADHIAAAAQKQSPVVRHASAHGAAERRLIAEQLQ